MQREQWRVNLFTINCSRRIVESDRRRSKRRKLTGQRWTAVVADDGSSSSLICFAASSSSVSVFSVFLLLFLTVQGRYQ